MPVESITGLPFDETYSIKSRSVISNEAILYIGLFNSSKKSTEERSNGVEKQIRPSFFATSKSFLCHSQGVCAFSYKE